MLHAADLLKALRTVIFLFAAVTVTGCITLKTTTLSSIPPNRNVIMLHADDSLWAVSNYTFSDNTLTGLIYQDSLKIKKLKVIHLYAAPLTAVNIEGTRLTVPTGNIGKTDYYRIEWWRTIGGTAIITYLLYVTLSSLIY